MIVYICCAGGATSGMYCNNIKKAAEELVEKYNIPCEEIDMKIFGTMDGKKVLENIKKYIK